MSSTKETKSKEGPGPVVVVDTMVMMTDAMVMCNAMVMMMDTMVMVVAYAMMVMMVSSVMMVGPVPVATSYASASPRHLSNNFTYRDKIEIC